MSPINLCSIRAQSMQQFNPRPKSAEKGINPNKSWCHFLKWHLQIVDWAWIEHGLNRFWKHFCVLKIIPYMVKIIKMNICMAPKLVRFNQILPFHRLFLMHNEDYGKPFSKPSEKWFCLVNFLRTRKTWKYENKSMS